MATINEIQAKFERRQYKFSNHAVDQSIIRDISVAEVEEAIASQSEMIEDYPNDKYGPSYLILVSQRRADHCTSVRLSEKATCKDYHSVRA